MQVNTFLHIAQTDEMIDISADVTRSRESHRLEVSGLSASRGLSPSEVELAHGALIEFALAYGIPEQTD